MPRTNLICARSTRTHFICSGFFSLSLTHFRPMYSMLTSDSHFGIVCFKIEQFVGIANDPKSDSWAPNTHCVVNPFNKLLCTVLCRCCFCCRRRRRRHHWPLVHCYIVSCFICISKNRSYIENK